MTPNGPLDPSEISLEVFKQTSEDFRQLNQIFWQAPTLIITVTGGLGVAVATLSITGTLRTVLLVFAGICNLAWIGVLIRLRRGVMDPMRRNLNAYADQYFTRNHAPKPGFIVLMIFCALLLMTGIGSMGAAMAQKKLFQDKNDRDTSSSAYTNVSVALGSSTRSSITSEVPTGAASK